jgi:SNF family Na+-dependent transporter
MNKKNDNLVKDTYVIALCNSIFSFVAGFAVFSVAGYYKKQTGLSWVEVQDILSGPSLAFVLYPSGLSLVEGFGAKILCASFFFTLYMLGLDSAFSLIEGAVLNLLELKWFNQFTRLQLLLSLCALCGFTTIFYCSDIGLYLLDVVDGYITACLLMIASMEAISIGWFTNKRESMHVCGATPVHIFDFSFLLGHVLLISLSLIDSFAIGIGISSIVIIIGSVIAIYLANEKSKFDQYIIIIIIIIIIINLIFVYF